MERHANYGLIGGLTIGLLAAAFVFVFWLGQSQFASSFDEYRIVFTGPVRGLSEGGEVQFNGIKVGEITKIELDARNPNRVIADVRLNEGTPVRLDTVATTESQGITGGSYIQLSAGTPTLPLLREASRESPPVIRSRQSSMQSLLQSGGETVARVNRLLSDDNIRNISLAIADIRSTTAELNARRAMFGRAEQMFERLDRAAADIEGAAQSARATIQGDGRQAFADMSDAARDLREGVREARQVIGRLNVAAGALAGENGPGIPQALASIDAAARSLESLSRQVQQSPRELIGRPAAREREIPQ